MQAECSQVQATTRLMEQVASLASTSPRVLCWLSSEPLHNAGRGLLAQVSGLEAWMMCAMTPQPSRMVVMEMNGL